MKSFFSTHWLSSKKPRKQRKFAINAPFHIKHNFLNANLSKELRKKYGKRSFPVRKGDEVLVMRGSFKKKKAKISIVDAKRTRLALENIQRTKKDGTKVNVWFNPSALQIQALTLDDKKRIASLQRTNKKPISESKPKSKEGSQNAPDKSASK
ncbi:MAG: 50S ribosomal protein L24 [Nanoarchaeota archaeon]|nr:50S ribosomal protein L24 [Nanoarchaeota archaeon]MBU0977788.1 50S ribosomal protein L24 [Nanoarchaeota archaeon]